MEGSCLDALDAWRRRSFERLDDLDLNCFRSCFSRATNARFSRPRPPWRLEATWRRAWEAVEMMWVTRFVETHFSKRSWEGVGGEWEGSGEGRGQDSVSVQGLAGSWGVLRCTWDES